MKFIHNLIAVGVTAMVSFNVSADNYPVTVQSCGEPVTFEQAPKKAVVHDLNMSEMMFALGLQERMAGVTGISGWYKMTPDFKQQLGDIPELAAKYPTMENLLSADPDLFFAGWYYGMKPGGEVTPQTLGDYQIPSYILTESCAHTLKEKPAVSMDTMYVDVLNLGKIFGVSERAEALVKGWRKRVEEVQKSDSAEQPKVFLFDSGTEKPFTAGRYAMPTALIEAAGGRNVMDDVEKSWGRVGWEAVAERNPEWIIILDYQKENGWQELRDFLQVFPPMAATDAVKNGRFIRLTYSEITPGPANIEAIEKIAAALAKDGV